jgi:hypothetical protein
MSHNPSDYTVGIGLQLTWCNLLAADLQHVRGCCKVSVFTIAIITFCFGFLQNPGSVTFTEIFFSAISIQGWVRPLSRVTGYGLDGRGTLLGRVRELSLCHRVQTASDVYPVHPVGIRGSFPGQQGRSFKLATHLHLMPWLRLSRTFSSLIGLNRVSNFIFPYQSEKIESL